jgi:anti-anti-sigma factor
MSSGTIGPAGFSIETHERDGTLCVTVRGELDLASTPQLEQLLLAALDEGREVELSLRSLDFMDSSGLRLLVVAHSRGQERFTLLAPPAGGPVARILNIAGLDRELTFVER